MKIIWPFKDLYMNVASYNYPELGATRMCTTQ